MYSFIEKEEKYIKDVLNELNYEIDSVQLNISSRKELGDYQFNGLMSLAKKYGKNPREIATQLVEYIKNDNHYKEINVAGPGFINITFSDEQLIDYVNELNHNININYHNENPKKIFMDYGGANVAKALHVGHLRSANIGEALKRLSNALGNETIGDAHLGDWGRPIGLVMQEIKTRYPNLPYFDESYTGDYPTQSPVTNDDLMEFYPQASLKSKEDETYLEEARTITAKFQSGDRGLTALWNHIMNVSKADIKRVYDKLNTTFEVWEGESDAYKYVPKLMELLRDSDIVTDSEGAKIIDISQDSDNHEIPPVLLVKSNGSASYETTDIACILERMEKFNPDEIWYLADSRQALHFEQVFRASKKAKIVNENTKLEFFPFGTMNGSDGKPFKTRDGGVMKLEDLLMLAYNECEKRVMENIKGDERKNIAETLSVATIKYADLIPYRLTDYNFDPVKFSELQGKTAPYLLYSTIRMKSLLQKAKESNHEYDTYQMISTPEDREIILNLINIRDVILKSYETKSLHEITDFLFRLTNSYNSLYSKYRILTEQKEEMRNSWLLLTKVVLENNIKLLNILGIDVPDRI